MAIGIITIIIIYKLYNHNPKSSWHIGDNDDPLLPLQDNLPHHQLIISIKRELSNTNLTDNIMKIFSLLSLGHQQSLLQ